MSRSHTYVEATVRLRGDLYRYGFVVDGTPREARFSLVKAIDAGNDLIPADGGDKVRASSIDLSSAVVRGALALHHGRDPIFSIDGRKLTHSSAA